MEEELVSAYHGSNVSETTNYFEGWYFKFSDKSSGNSLALIVGICSSSTQKYRHSFIQILFNGEMEYSKFDVSDFSASSEKFEVCLGKRSQRKFLECKLNKLSFRTEKYDGEFEIAKFKPWPVTKFSRGAMGWVGLLPVSCNHGVLNFHSLVTKGNLKVAKKGSKPNCKKGQKKEEKKDVDDEKTEKIVKKESHKHVTEVVYTSGSCYIEKDWGSAFPEEYMWFQCNNFENSKDVCVMGGIATFKLFKFLPVRGFCIALYLKGELYKFTTYNLSKIVKRKETESTFELQVESKNFFMTIKLTKDKGVMLYAPYIDRMVLCVNETISSICSVCLKEKKGDRIIFKGKGMNAGLELIDTANKDFSKLSTIETKK